MDKYLPLLVLFYIFNHKLDGVASDQVVLLDTTKEATLEWTRYPYGPQAQTPGVSTNYVTTLGGGGGRP
ncbi:hypothetical protein pipiens_005722 [Culex pipiens pipiens]|uniref:Uncharacterized protein n=1 Tax=Culex pipiens pipiens TaxID=38569 RepID=A0ABD1DU93_CULPP